MRSCLVAGLVVALLGPALAAQIAVSASDPRPHPASDELAPANGALLEGRFTGRIVDEAGQPLSGATVDVFPATAAIPKSAWALGKPTSTSSWIVGSVRSGADGRFDVTARLPVFTRSDDPEREVGLGWRDLVRFDPGLLVHLEGRATRFVPLRAFFGGTIEAGDIALGSGGSVTGTVVDGHGRPLAGARVSASFGQDARGEGEAAREQADSLAFVESSEAGRFEIRGLQPGPGYISAQMPGGGYGSADDLKLQAGAVLDVGHIVLPADLTLAGRVRDAAGAAAVGAQVVIGWGQDESTLGGAGDLSFEALAADSFARVTTDVDGRFSLRGVDPARFFYAVRADDGTELYRPGVQADGHDLDLVLPAPGTIVLHLLARAGEELEQAWVRAAGLDRPFLRSKPRDPHWVFMGPRPIPPVEHELRASVQNSRAVLPRVASAANWVLLGAAGHGCIGLALPAVKAGESFEQDVVLPAPHAVRGGVVTSAGQVVADAHLALRPEGEFSATLSLGAVSDANGRFVFEGVGPGKWQLAAESDRTQPAAIDVLVAAEPGQDAEVSVVLQPATEIRGRVVSGDGAPLAGNWVELRRDCEAKDPVAVRTGPGGRFLFTDLDAGSWCVLSSNTDPVHVDLVAGKAEDVTLVSRRRPIVRGRILAGDDPVENADVSPWDSSSGGGGWVQIQTPASGEYEIEMPHAGSFEIEASAPDGCGNAEGEFMVTAGWDEVRQFDVQLGRCGFSGLVRAAGSGEPLAGVTVKATVQTENGGLACFWAASDAEGRFRIQPLQPGSYTVEVEGRMYTSTPTEAIALADGERRSNLVFEASPTRAEINVNVDFGEREDLRYRLTLQIEGPPGEHVEADPRSGHCRFESLMPGTYSLRILRPRATPRGFGSAGDVLVEKAIVLKAGDSTTIDLVVPEGA
jgi:protocatechuate 3,4-dioxygenase beta subunit